MKITFPARIREVVFCDSWFVDISMKVANNEIPEATYYAVMSGLNECHSNTPVTVTIETPEKAPGSPQERSPFVILEYGGQRLAGPLVLRDGDNGRFVVTLDRRQAESLRFALGVALDDREGDRDEAHARAPVTDGTDAGTIEH